MRRFSAEDLLICWPPAGVLVAASWFMFHIAHAPTLGWFYAVGAVIVAAEPWWLRIVDKGF